jgi:YesN/AraC family two-component response regulator
VFLNARVYIGEEKLNKILVIEAKAQTRKLFLKGLKTQGFFTLSAENGLTGVQLAKEQLPDLIISGIMLPELDGYDVLSTLRQDPVTAIIPFIFVSPKATQADIRKGMQLGANDYLTEPFTLEELLKAIAIQLEKQTLFKQWYATKSQKKPENVSHDTATMIVAPEINLASEPQLNEVFSFIEANYHKPISLSDVALAVGYSRAYLTHLMRQQTGQTVQQWIIEHRMAAARSLLLETDQMMEEIATQVGYSNVVHFFRQFRQIHGTTPHAWRISHRSQPTNNKIKRIVSPIKT